LDLDFLKDAFSWASQTSVRVPPAVEIRQHYRNMQVCWLWDRWRSVFLLHDSRARVIYHMHADPEGLDCCALAQISHTCQM